jgi:PAS domain S-box-containing protein
MPHTLRNALGAHLFDQAVDPVFVLDPAGTFLDINRAGARYLGRPAQDILGRSVAEIFPTEHAAEHLEVVRRVVATGEPFLEERPTAIGGETFHFQYAVHRLDGEDGTPLGVLGMVRDVTSLVALERRYAELYDKATDALFGIDREGRIRVLNRQAEEMSGYSRDLVESLHFSEVIAPEEVGRLKRYFEDRLAGREAPTEYEVRYLHATGEERWAEVHVSRHPTVQDTFQASIRDVTARKRLEALRSEFLHMVSHDVKNPLTVIQGFATAMASGAYGEPSPEQAEALARIVEASRRVRHLMDQFLLAERLDAEGAWTPEPGTVGAPLDAAVCAFQAEAEARGLRLEVNAGEARQLRVADGTAVRHILENLLSNALKFTPPGGRVAVRALHDPGELRLEVEDTGPGIPEAELGRVFERFFRGAAARAAPGSGLGLHIVRRLADLCGGRVAVASHPGEGTRFTVSLPLAAED